MKMKLFLAVILVSLLGTANAYAQNAQGPKSKNEAASKKEADKAAKKAEKEKEKADKKAAADKEKAEKAEKASAKLNNQAKNTVSPTTNANPPASKPVVQAVNKSADKAVGTDSKGRTIYEGPRGGRYVLTAKGNKEYLKKSN